MSGCRLGRWLGPLRTLPILEFAVIQPDLAFIRLQLRAQRAQQRTFAGAIGAEHTQDFTGLQVQGHVGQYGFATTADLQVFHSQHQARPRNSR